MQMFELMIIPREYREGKTCKHMENVSRRMFAQPKNKMIESELKYTIIVGDCSSGSRIFFGADLFDIGHYNEMLSSSERQTPQGAENKI